MKKYLTLVLVMVSALAVGLSIRLGVKTWAPGLYSALWGPVLVYQPMIAQTGPADGAAVAAAEKFDATIVATEEPKKPIAIEERDDTKELYATGRIWGNGLSWVVMSDGTVRSTDDNTEKEKPRLERIRRHFMDFEGKRYYYKEHRRESSLGLAGGQIGQPKGQAVEMPEAEALPESLKGS